MGDECEFCGHFEEEHVTDADGSVHCTGDGKLDNEGGWICECEMFEELPEPEEE